MRAAERFVHAVRVNAQAPGDVTEMVECGINLGPFTGVFWEFVFHKDGKRGVLRTTRENGRG